MAPPKLTDAAADDNYQSTPTDRKWGWGLGIGYILLAIFLAWMLFKIWPPTPWPTDKTLEENQQLAKNLKECECATPTPTPTPPTPVRGNEANPQTPNQGTGAAATTTPAQTATATPTPPNATGAVSSGGADSQPNSPKAGATESPSPKPTPSDTLINIPISFFWGYWCYRTTFDERLIMLVIVAGILGSFVHGATSLADFMGNNRFNKNWTWFYLLRPAIGMSLALVFYFVVRGGFLTTTGGAKEINPYGIAALAGLVGMFSKQATDKLSELFSTLFRAAKGEGDDKRSGPLKPGPATPNVTALQPANMQKGTAETVTVTGTGFIDGCKVFLDATEQVTTFVSATTVTAYVSGPIVANASTLKLKVVNPDGAESAAINFTVDP